MDWLMTTADGSHIQTGLEEDWQKTCFSHQLSWQGWQSHEGRWFSIQCDRNVRCPPTGSHVSALGPTWWCYFVGLGNLEFSLNKVGHQEWSKMFPTQTHFLSLLCFLISSGVSKQPHNHNPASIRRASPPIVPSPPWWTELRVWAKANSPLCCSSLLGIWPQKHEKWPINGIAWRKAKFIQTSVVSRSITQRGSYWTNKVPQLIEGLTTNTGVTSSTPRIHLAEGENWFSQMTLWPPPARLTRCIHKINTCKNKDKTKQNKHHSPYYHTFVVQDIFTPQWQCDQVLIINWLTKSDRWPILPMERKS